MIPSVTHSKWAALVKGDIKAQFKVFAGNMMLSQCNRRLKNDQSADMLRTCIQEAHSFFTKYEGVYGQELAEYFR